MSKTDQKNNQTHDLKNVEPGSDADAQPVPKVGEAPPDPNQGAFDRKK